MPDVRAKAGIGQFRKRQPVERFVLGRVHAHRQVVRRFDEEIELHGHSAPGGVGELEQEWPCRPDAEPRFLQDFPGQGLKESLSLLDAAAR